jgi:hypothetical protein
MFMSDILRLGRYIGLLNDKFGTDGEEQLVATLLSSPYLFAGNDSLRNWLSSRDPKTLSEFTTHMTSFFVHRQRMCAGRPHRRAFAADDFTPAPAAAHAPHEDRGPEHRSGAAGPRHGAPPRSLVPSVPEGWGTDGKPRQAPFRGRPVASYLVETSDGDRLGNEPEDDITEDGSCRC